MLRWLLLISAMCHLWGLCCLTGPIAHSHVAVSMIGSAEVGCCYAAMWHVEGWGGPVRVCHVACWWGPHVRSVWWWGPPGWGGPIGCWHVALRWPSEMLTRVTLSLPSDSVCICLGSPVCTQMSLCPQIAPRAALIKSQPLIFPFNLFYLPWIYSDSSTYPKIMKFSPKIPKFMVIIPVIFNSIFTLASLN
jgi:hypothetical protein